MEFRHQDVDDIREELEKANAKVVHLSKYIAAVANDKEKSIKMSDENVARLETNIKMLKGQLELVASEKSDAKKKLSEVEVECREFQREVELLKERNEKQGIKIEILKREIESFNEQKEQLFSKFNLLKSQEKLHDIIVGSVKREFEQKIVDFMSSTSASSILARIEECPANIGMESNEVDPLSIQSTSDRNHCVTRKSLMQVTTQVSSYKHSTMRKISGEKIKISSMRKSSGTKIKRSTSIAVDTRKFLEVKHQLDMAPRGLPTEGIMKRPKRLLTCPSCSKRYHSTPSQAFCGCKYVGSVMVHT